MMETLFVTFRPMIISFNVNSARVFSFEEEHCKMPDC